MSARTCNASTCIVPDGFSRLRKDDLAMAQTAPGASDGSPGHGSAEPLSADESARIDAYWRAANYLSVGQIYLLDNPLLREPLRPEHVKPRLLGHWGTTPDSTSSTCT